METKCGVQLLSATYVPSQDVLEQPTTETALMHVSILLHASYHYHSFTRRRVQRRRFNLFLWEGKLSLSLTKKWRLKHKMITTFLSGERRDTEAAEGVVLTNTELCNNLAVWTLHTWAM